MGAQLDNIFKIIEQKKGLKGRMRLVVRSGVPRRKAASIQDDPNLVEQFKMVASDILGHDINELL